MKPHLLVLTVLAAALAPLATAQEYAATYQHGAVAADHPRASQAGAEMLRLGGNAVDAAVATSFTLSVVRPESCGIGGGGFMVIYLPDDPTHGSVRTALNYRETAPRTSAPDMFERTELPRASTSTGLAAGVPGTVAGLLEALEKYGTLDRATVLQPAIDAAVGGWIADAQTVGAIRGGVARLEREEREAGATLWRVLLREGEIEIGDRVRNLQQGSVLADIADHGRAGFYDGRVARQIVAASDASGGILSLKDLRDYRPVDMEAVEFGFGGNTFISMPPPSSGGVAMAETLGIFARLGGFGTDDPGAGHALDGETAHRLVESLKHAFADRAEWLADPLKTDAPYLHLLEEEYLDARADLFDESVTLEPGEYGTRMPERRGRRRQIRDDSGTSHLSVIDRWGGAVACTETINTGFGSMVAVEGGGFCLNNEMDDFTTRLGEANVYGLVQSPRNLPTPGKRPLSSMSPTVVIDETGEVVAVAGASGGPRIITGTMQVLLNVLARGMSAGDAVAAPRMHHQWLPDAVRLEPGLRGGESVEGADAMRSALESRGHALGEIGGVGVVQLIVRDAEGLHAACDPRKGGRPAGH